MEPNRDKLQLYTGDPIDKIVAPMVQRTIVNDGNTTGHTGTWQTAKIVEQDYANPYGKRCFVRGRWSIDGGATWFTFETREQFTFNINIINPSQPSQSGKGLLAAVSIGVSDEVVRVVTANGHHGNITVNATTGSQSYSPISHTFLVEYTLFEVE